MTGKQLHILRFIATFKRDRGYAPSRQVIADTFELSKSTVQGHVDALRDAGMLEAPDGRRWGNCEPTDRGNKRVGCHVEPARLANRLHAETGSD